MNLSKYLLFTLLCLSIIALTNVSGLRCFQDTCINHECDQRKYGQCVKGEDGYDAEFCLKMTFEVNSDHLVKRLCASKGESDEMGRRSKCYNGKEALEIPWVKGTIDYHHQHGDKIKYESLCICNENGCNGVNSPSIPSFAWLSVTTLIVAFTPYLTVSVP